MHPTACLPELQLLLPCGCCWLQVSWSSLPTSGSSAGMHPMIAGMGQVGFLGKGEENLASPAPGWVILGVFCAFFLIPASQEASPFQQPTLSGSETAKQGFAGVFGKVFLSFLGMGRGQRICCPWGGGSYLVSKTEPLALTSSSFPRLGMMLRDWDTSVVVPGSSRPAQPGKQVKFWGLGVGFFTESCRSRQTLQRNSSVPSVLPSNFSRLP